MIKADLFAEVRAMLNVPEAERFLSTLAEVRCAGDVDALVDLFHADSVFRIVGFVTPVTGKQELHGTLKDLVETYEFLEWRPIQTFVHNDEIAVRQRLKVRHRASGQVAETETCEFLTLKDGRCTSFVQFADTALIEKLSS